MLYLFRKIWNNTFWSNVILWAVLYIVFLHDYIEKYLGATHSLGNALLVFVIIIVPIYIHNLVLLPKLLLKQKFAMYLFSLIMLLLVTGIIISFGKGNLLLYTLRYLLVFFFAVAVNFAKREIVSEMERKSIELNKREMELNALKAQVNPHFLFNTLNNIYALTLTKSDDAPNAVLELAGLMRYQLKSTEKDLVSLEEEIEFLRQYFSLEKIRVGNRANITFKVELDEYSLWIPPMIIMTFVENAFKHGVNRDKSKSFIRIFISSVKHNLEVIVENGKPEKKSVETGFGGYGLKNVKRRLELLLPNKHEINVQETDDKYVTIIKLKL
ncbi:MAG: histidine kinase [Ichthyobacteriaceae bacterium]|nr:histidine kinase [Ichthyobacteriaceae bacterium]